MAPKIVFIQKELEDRLGVMILSAYLKAHGFESEIIINPYKNINKIKTSRPDFIGISLPSPSVDWSLATSRFLKQHLPKTLIILGGPHPTFFPAVVEQEAVDMVCVGEGEKPLLQLMQSYDGTIASIENTPNLWVKKGSEIIRNPVMPLLTQEELSALPNCDRDYYAHYPRLRKSPHRRLWASRGCPFSCAYCFNSNYKELYRGRGKMVRQRSVDSFIDELCALKKIGTKVIDFVDDHFLMSKQWVLEFCDKYKRQIALPFVCNSTAQKIDSELVKALKEAGCWSINFAIESGVESIRNQIYNKPISDRDIFNAADALHAHDMPFLTYNMIGLPEETPEDIYQTVSINQQIKTTYPWCSIFQPYPGTTLGEKLMKDDARLHTQSFTYSYFQESIIGDSDRRRMIRNAVKLFACAVKRDMGYEAFTRLIRSHSVKSQLFPFVFYWYYGQGIRSRYGYSWFELFKFWLYARE